MLLRFAELFKRKKQRSTSLKNEVLKRPYVQRAYIDIFNIDKGIQLDPE